VPAFLESPSISILYALYRTILESHKAITAKVKKR
jgi:hypothetical protein